MEMLRPSDLVKTVLQVASETEAYTSVGLEIFYLNPATYTETLASNWVRTNAPGKNAPHLHWVSTGERAISFEALVTKEASNNNQSEAYDGEEEPSPSLRLTNIARSSPRAVINLIKLYAEGTKLTNDNSAAFNLDISKKLDFYRALCYGQKNPNDERSLIAPPIVKLTGLGTEVSLPFIGDTSRDTYWVLVTLQIIHQKLDPQQRPIQAMVRFTFVEYPAERKTYGDLVEGYID